MIQREADNPEPEGFACQDTRIGGECLNGSEVNVSIRNTSCLLLTTEGLTAFEVWRQLWPSLGWHMGHWRQSNQRTNQAPEWWKEHRETGPINPAERQDRLKACQPPFLLYWNLPQWTHLEERSHWRKEKGKMNWKCALIFIIFLLKKLVIRGNFQIHIQVESIVIMEHPSSHHWAPTMNQLMTHCVSSIPPPTHHPFPGLRKYAFKKGQSWAQGTKMSLGQCICVHHIHKASQMALVIKNLPANARDTRGVWRATSSTSSQSPARLSD